MSKQSAICLTFLMQGFDERLAVGTGHSSPVQVSLYNEHATLHGGYVGIVSEFYDYAEWIENYLTLVHNEDEHDGVFHYEVTEELGGWLAENPQHTDIEFRSVAAQAIGMWFSDEPGHTMPDNMVPAAALWGSSTAGASSSAPLTLVDLRRVALTMEAMSPPPGFDVQATAMRGILGQIDVQAGMAGTHGMYAAGLRSVITPYTPPVSFEEEEPNEPE